MTDREKILIWLDKCLGVCNENTNCDLCPFDKSRTYGYNCAEQLEDAIRGELMGEKEPVPPTVDEELEDKNLFKCVCGGSLGIKGIFRYCPWCGRKVMWHAPD